MLNYLEAFTAVAACRSFSKAARLIGVSQPAVSRQISQLEGVLGQALFQRDRNAVALTPSGSALFERVSPLHAELMRTLADAKGTPDRIDGLIRLGCLPEAGPFIELALSFQKLHPSVNFQVENLDNREIAAALRAAQLDFGIVSIPPPGEGIRSFPLYKQESALVTRQVNRRDPLDFPRSAAVVPFVRCRTPSPLHLDPESFLLPFVKKYGSILGIKDYEVKFAVNSMRSMVQVLLSQDIYAVMPLHVVDGEIKANRLRIIGPQRLAKQIHLAHFADPRIGRRLSLFKQYLQSELRNHVK